jgi:hypothetical protein
MLEHNESYNKMVGYSYEVSDRSQAAEEERDEAEANLNLASGKYQKLNGCDAHHAVFSL